MCREEEAELALVLSNFSCEVSKLLLAALRSPQLSLKDIRLLG